MREVQFEGEGQVPGIAVAVGYVLVLTSIAMLVLYVHHIGQSLRVSALIELVGTDTRRLLDQHYPDALGAPDDDPRVVVAPNSGVLIAMNRKRLLRLAVDANCTLHVVPAIGTFVPAGAPLLRVEGDPSRLDRDSAVAALSSGLERTLDQDVAYGFRLLVDMTERALSDSAFLDPTTAVQAIDRLHDGLRQLAVRVIPDGTIRDDAGHVRVTVPTMDWDAYVRLAFEEPRLAGSGSPQVTRRLVAALTDLIHVAPADRREVLEEQLALLRDAVLDDGRARPDQMMALEPDPQGIGVAAGDGSASHQRSRDRQSHGVDASSRGEWR